MTYVRFLPMMLICALMYLSCSGSDPTKPEDQQPEETGYKSFGQFPQYAGTWESKKGGSGTEIIDDAFLSIVIDQAGLFEGVYCHYEHTGTMYINVGFVSLPVKLYNPTSERDDISGALDFTNKKGICTFEHLDEYEFTLTDVKDDSFRIVFQDGFEFDEAIVARLK